MTAIFEPRQKIWHQKIKQILIYNSENEKKTRSIQHRQPARNAANYNIHCESKKTVPLLFLL